MITTELMIMLLVVAAIYFVIGAFWYSPLGFGKLWMKTINMTADELGKDHNMMRSMIVSYLVGLFQVFVLAMVISHLKVQSVIYSMIIGALIATAFGFMSVVRSHHYVKRNLGQMAIDHGYDIAAGAICAGIITWWLAG